MQKPKITEIKVRMDCNGCIQKIKKALHGINGIYDLYIDFPQQKLTIIGWADPEKIVKAIKKARKTAMICSHSEVPDPPPSQPTEKPPPDQPTEQPPHDQQAAQSTGPTPPDQQAAQSPAGPAPPEAAPPPPVEPPKDQPAPENPLADTNPSNATSSSAQPIQPSDPKEAEPVHFIYYHPSPDHGYRYGYSPSYRHSYGGQWNSNSNYSRFHQEPGPQQAIPRPVTHNYNTYKPSPSVTRTYNTYRPSPNFTDNYIRSPPQYTYHHRPEHYGDDYNNYSNGNRNGNITSIFSDENPNACRIV